MGISAIVPAINLHQPIINHDQPLVMPIEIRELVIQARVQDGEASATTDNTIQREKSQTGEAPEVEELSPEVIERIVERCLQRTKEWLAEQSIR